MLSSMAGPSSHKMELTATDRRENTGFLKGNCLPGGQRILGLTRVYFQLSERMWALSHYEMAHCAGKNLIFGVL